MSAGCAHQADVDRDATGRPIRVVGVVMDVTERKRAQDDLVEKAAVLERAHELARLGSFSTEVATRQVACSRELARLLGAAEPFCCNVEEFRDRFVVEEHRENWSLQLEPSYRYGGRFTLESRLRRVDGRTMWVRVHGNVETDELGSPLRAIGVVQDIEDQRLLEEQVSQSQRLDAVGQLASGIAHDFNNLLLVIGGNAQLALAGSETDIGEEMAEILRAAERARELIRHLLAFSRSDISEPRTIELNDAVLGVRRMLDRLLEETIEIETELTHAPTTVYADPGQLEQVLLNLAVNARDAMPDGGRLTIATSANADNVVLDVKDTGVGMDDATRERIFDPFFTTKPSGQGTGLGLSTIYGIVTSSGGRIAVDSAPSRGTTFTIALPRVEAPGEREDFGELHPLVVGSGERILIVEDDPMVRAVAAELLSRAGYEIETAENGEEALGLFDDGQGYDLVVSDLMMPKMTGPQLISALRARGFTLPTVYMSGYAESTAMPPADDPRATFIPKPFSGEQVTAAVRSLLHPQAA